MRYSEEMFAVVLLAGQREHTHCLYLAMGVVPYPQFIFLEVLAATTVKGVVILGILFVSVCGHGPDGILQGHGWA